MIIRGIGGRWFVAALSAAAVLTSGCATSVDADELPGVYRSDKTGGKIRLDSDGTFTATDISADEATGSGDTDPIDFSGRWEFVARDEASDFVYLTIKEGGLGKVGGIQLYPKDSQVVELHPDPDGPPSVVLAKADAP
ncbi:hypothetical protein [Streptomyces sp. NPDC046925]|uniref:hypothetical protein n=1 Tax=Streptomyces sp. NPDC046925 TaxID=3155375 RepID=UPI0034106963